MLEVQSESDVDWWVKLIHFVLNVQVGGTMEKKCTLGLKYRYKSIEQYQTNIVSQYCELLANTSTFYRM